MPAANRTLVVYHDSWSYFGREYGFGVQGALQAVNFAEPSAAELRRMVQQVLAASVPAFFGSEVFPTSVLEQVASRVRRGVRREPLRRLASRQGRRPGALLCRHDGGQPSRHRRGTRRRRLRARRDRAGPWLTRSSVSSGSLRAIEADRPSKRSTSPSSLGTSSGSSGPADRASPRCFGPGTDRHDRHLRRHGAAPRPTGAPGSSHP